MNDPFFTAKLCKRCGKKLGARIMSWFTDDVICTDCSVMEDSLKEKLRAAGKPDMEGCGYVPQI